MAFKLYTILATSILSLFIFDLNAQVINVNEFNSCEDCVFYISERSVFFDDGGKDGYVSKKKQVTTYRAGNSKEGYLLSMYFTDLHIPNGAILHITYGDIGSSNKEVIDLKEVQKISNIKAQEITIEYYSSIESGNYRGWAGKIDIHKSLSSLTQSSSQLESDCPYAIPLCANNTAVALGGQYTDLGAINDEDGSCYGNLGDGGSVWYSFSPLSSGPLDFRITPQGSTDYDFVLWDITNGCESGKRSEVSCNYSLYTGQTGLSSSLCGISEGSCTDDCSSQSKAADCTRFNNRVNVTVGRRYAVCINFYSGSNDGFVIKFQNEAGSVAISDITPPTLSSALTPNCNNANSFNIKFSEWIDCSTLQDADLTIPGRTVTITSNNCTSNRTNNITINVNPPLTAGSYTLTGQNILDLCGNNMNSSFNIVIGAQPNPSITPPVPVCKNPNTSGGTVNSPNNQVLTASGGTTYLWSTGATTASVTVNQAATRTYTVTAYNGACYVTASTTVVVQQANPVSLGPDKFYCGTPVTITANPSVAGFNYQFFRGANLTTNGTSVQNGTNPSLTVSPANNTTYRVIVTDAKGCKAQDDIVVKVTSATGNAVITVPGTNFCPNANPVLITASPDGGTFSGPGMVGDYFNPSIAGVGNHAITYTTTNACGTFNGTKNIRVINGTLPNLGLNPTYCVTSPDVVLAPTPKCGTYVGTGIITSGVCNAANTSYTTSPVFSPAAAGVGTHVITYSGVGCGNSFTVNVLDATGAPSISGLNGPYCTTEPAITITGTPSGGVFSGPGISGNIFTPSVAGVGSHPIKYKITTCSGSDSVIALIQVVSSAAAATISYGGSPYCSIFSATQNVTLTGTSGGSFSAAPAGLSINTSTGAITPSTSNPGNYTVTYSIPGSGSCPGYTTTATLTVSGASNPAFNSIPAFCSGQTAPVLPTISTNGISGTWSPSIVDNTVGGNYTFTPNAGICASQVSISTTVNPSVTPTFDPIPSICSGDIAPILPLTSKEGISGTWSPAIVSNTNNGIYTFNPTAGQCALNASVSVTVNSAGALPTFSINPNLCKGAVSPVLPNVSSNGISGTWSPAVVSNSSGGTYTFTPNAGQCAQSVSITINILDTYSTTVPAQICTGQTFTLPDGSTVNSAGSYPVTLTAKNGCDSVVTTDLTVVNSLTTTINDTICQGSSYTLPDGSSVSSSGAFAVKLLSSAGCDSIVTVNLAVNPTFNITVPAKICNGSSYTLPDGSTVNSGGIYPVTLTASNGCDSVVTINLTVNSSYNIVVRDTICSGGNFILPDGSTVNSSGSYSVTLTSSSTCDSVVVTDLSVLPVFATSVPAQICTGQTFTLPDGSTVNTAGIFPVTLTAKNGCDSVVTTDLTVVNTLTTTINDTICQGSSYTLPDGSSVSSSGTFVVTLLSSAGCDSVVTVNLAVNPTFSISVPAKICNGSSYTLPDGSTVNSGGIYPVTLAASNGCDSVVTINLIVNPSYNIVVRDTICSGGTFTLPDGSTVNSSGSYSVTLTSSSTCDSVVVTDLTVLPVFATTVPAQICTGQNFTLPDGSTVNTSGIFPVTLTATNGCDSVVTTDLTVVSILTTTINDTICQGSSYTLPDGSSVSSSGTFAVTLLSSTGCDSVVTVNLAVNPTFNITVPAKICNGSTYTLPDGSTVNSGGIYPVTLAASNGCDSVVTINLTENPSYNIVVKDTICSGGNFILPDGSTVNSSGSYSVTLTSSSTCDSVVVTDLTVLPVFATTVPAQICTGQTFTLPDGSTVNTAGLFPVTLTATNGCDSLVTTDLTVVNTLTTTFNDTICQGSSYTLPDGSSVSSSGTFITTLSSSGGCDSVITINLTLVNALTTSFTTSICQGSSYTLPDGNVVSTGGVYSVTLVSSSGCDSIISIDVKVNPSFNSSFSTSICAGSSYTLPDGSVINSAGIYTVKLLSANGCDSIIIVNLSIAPAINVNVSAQICNGQIYTLPDGSTVNTSGIFPVTLIASSGCDSIITTNLSFAGTLTSSVNAQICTGQTYTLPDGVVVNSSGIYTSTLKSVGGCDSVVTTKLDVVGTLTSIITAKICSGKTYTLPDGTIVGSSGSFVTTLTSTGGCDSVITTNLTVINTFTSFVEAIICTGQSYTLPDGTVVNSAGSYLSTLISSEGCDSIISTKLTISNNVTSSVAAQICFGKNYTLPDGIVVNSSGIYTSTMLSSGGCDSIITTNLNVSPAITSNVSAQICSGQTYTLPDGITVNSSGIYTSTISSSGGCDSVITTNLTILNSLSSSINAKICKGQIYILPDGTSVTTEGNYSVTLASSGGCDSIVTVILVVGEFPTLSLGTDTTLCTGSSFTLSVNQDTAATYLWSDGSTSNSISIADPGLYFLTVTNDCGSVTDSIEVIFDECTVCGVYAPNAFSPNGDGVNDQFTPLFTCEKLEPYLFRVYNRWNQMVFETNIPGIGWDAYFEGQLQPTDSYIYYISYYNTTQNKTIVQKGTVALLR